MIAFPRLLLNAADDAGMKTPPDPDNFDAEQFPHWDVFVKVQVGASLPYWTAHHDNAKLIADLSDEEIKTITYAELLERGLAVGYSK